MFKTFIKIAHHFTQIQENKYTVDIETRVLTKSKSMLLLILLVQFL
ncbi:hypothetical protein P5673_028166 [Acropora cervicornis]|uniref:Uncharacterized protein n=1 Tax=Acropora cervicornis TaxID=6130 RepID=A0AAD9PXV9_ACRCE|nr:hypothetical protein P5673_028166 [Acropora cervicornis]